MTRWEHAVRLYQGQDFEAIRQTCRREGRLFEDPLFPAQSESLCHQSQQSISKWRDIVWRRPGEIVDDPQLIVNGMKRTDPNQGDLGTLTVSHSARLRDVLSLSLAVGNCWFIAAMSALTQNALVLRRVIPADQSFDRDRYGE